MSLLVRNDCTALDCQGRTRRRSHTLRLTCDPKASLTHSILLTPETVQARHRTAPGVRAERQERLRHSFGGHGSSFRTGRGTASKDAGGDWPALYLREHQADQARHQGAREEAREEAPGDWPALYLKHRQDNAENQTAKGDGHAGQDQGVGVDGHVEARAHRREVLEGRHAELGSRQSGRAQGNRTLERRQRRVPEPTRGCSWRRATAVTAAAATHPRSAGRLPWPLAYHLSYSPCTDVPGVGRVTRV
jgi:hypothetical protein